MAQTKADKNRKAREKRSAAKRAIEMRAREIDVYARWRVAEALGRVQFVCEAECEALESFEPDFEHCRDKDQSPADAKAEWYRVIERDGIWMYASQFRTDETKRWETADTIGGVEGTIKGTGYDTDLMSAALDALDKAFQAEADALASRATFASVTA